MKALSDSVAYLSECRRDIPLGSAFPLSCCDLFSASFSICHSDKRVTGCVSVCAAWAAGEKLSADPGDLQKPQSRE